MLFMVKGNTKILYFALFANDLTVFPEITTYGYLDAMRTQYVAARCNKRSCILRELERHFMTPY